jgi:hypothetical protein
MRGCCIVDGDVGRVNHDLDGRNVTSKYRENDIRIQTQTLQV